MLRFPTWTSDQIEKAFFGRIDTDGRDAINFFSNYSGYTDRVYKLFPFLCPCIDAQRFRTARGLDQLKSLIRNEDRNTVLVAMQELFTLHTTMWAEGIWEFVRARQTKTKFIVSDEPVMNPSPSSIVSYCRTALSIPDLSSWTRWERERSFR